MSSYKVLSKQQFLNGRHSIIPIRFEDRYDIMRWRNEQLYHLRQEEPLTKEVQDVYFVNVVSKLFDQKQPNQILFSFLENDICIGYGGLVHINWIDKNAEISFIMSTSLEKDYFEIHWKTYLQLIEKVAFEEIKLHKIYTYAFDLRPRLYNVLEQCGFCKEAVLKEHCYFDKTFKDVIIHSRINQKS
jgi:RimJ/RimL family protein N-acetyltransferase